MKFSTFLLRNNDLFVNKYFLYNYLCLHYYANLFETLEFHFRIRKRMNIDVRKYDLLLVQSRSINPTSNLIRSNQPSESDRNIQFYPTIGIIWDFNGFRYDSDRFLVRSDYWISSSRS
jgi:hypothetical protein